MPISVSLILFLFHDCNSSAMFFCFSSSVSPLLLVQHADSRNSRKSTLGAGWDHRKDNTEKEGTEIRTHDSTVWTNYVFGRLSHWGRQFTTYTHRLLPPFSADFLFLYGMKDHQHNWQRWKRFVYKLRRGLILTISSSGGYKHAE